MATLSLRQQQPHTLASKAEECMASFQLCLNNAASIHPRELSLVEDQLARFSVWAGNMKVFGSMRQSLDHRLREAEEVRDTFEALLEAIKYRTENCTSSLEALDHEQSDDTVKDVDQVFQHAVQGVADQISLLHKLSNTIRRASKEAQNVEAKKAPRIRDSEGNDAEGFLQQVFAHYIRDRFPATSETIQQRLAGTMVLRWKQNLYRRLRYENNPIHVQRGPATPVVTVPRAQPAARPQNLKAEAQQETEDIQSQRPSVHKSLAQSATTLAAEKFHKASAPSLISVAKTVALNSHEQLVFPPAPTAAIKRKQMQLIEQRKTGLSDMRRRLEGQDRNTDTKDKTPSQDWEDAVDAVGEVVCPFCFHALPARDIVDETKWNRHVIGDLDAYICLFEECESPEEMYGHSSQWLKHMQGHTLRWRCASKAHDDLSFTSREDYIEHMKTFHKSRLTDAQLRLLADKSSRPIGQIFEFCPLCGIEGTCCNIEEHVIGHLRLLAIKSLPPHDAAGFEGPANVSTVASSMRSRSTIRDFMDTQSDSTASIDYDDQNLPYGRLEQYVPSRNIRSSSPFSSSNSYLSSAQGNASEDLQQQQQQPKVVKMDPDCAICHAPAAALCDCEAKALEVAIRQAESRILQPLSDEAANWVCRHAIKRVLTRLRTGVSEIEGDRLSALDELKHTLDDASGDASKTADTTFKHKINRLWSEASQANPSIMESSSMDQFYSLVNYSLPSDSDPAVRAPPLGNPIYKQRIHYDSDRPYRAYPPNPSSMTDGEVEELEDDIGLQRTSTRTFESPVPELPSKPPDSEMFQNEQR